MAKKVNKVTSMGMGEFLGSLVGAASKVGTAFQLAAVIAVGVFGLTLYFKPVGVSVIAPYLPLGVALVSLLLGQLFVHLSKFNAKQRPTIFFAALFFGILVLVVFVGSEIYVFNQTHERQVDVSLVVKGEPLHEPFKIEYKLPNRDQTALESRDGRSIGIRGVPSSAKVIDFPFIKCSGYKPKTGQKFEIDEAGQIRIEMEPTDKPPEPMSQHVFPDPSFHVPDQAVVREPPKVEPSKVLLIYDNKTNDDISLWLYNCTHHYDKDVPLNDRMSRWIKLPFPADSRPGVFNRFHKGSGWFVVYVCKEGQQFFPIKAMNLLEHQNSNLVVTKESESGLENPYKAVLSKKEE